MPLRRDPTIWYNLPGVIAAYQPQYAPGFDASLLNVRNGGDGIYKNVIGVRPTFSPPTGWGFNGSSQYLKTAIIPANDQTWSALTSFSNVNTSAVRTDTLLGSVANSPYATFHLRAGSNVTNGVRYGNGNQRDVVPRMGFGVLGVAGSQGYRDGLPDGTVIGTQTGTFPALNIGARNLFGASIDEYLAGNMYAVVIASRIFSAAEMQLASQQMWHLENPAWSVWARKRQWYYAPSALAAIRRRTPDAGRIGSRGVIE